MFDRKRDAEAWEEDQKRRLRTGEWFDQRRGRVALSVVASAWLHSRQTLKRNSRALEVGAWKRPIEPRFGKVPVASITTATCPPGWGVWWRKVASEPNERLRRTAER